MMSKESRPKVNEQAHVLFAQSDASKFISMVGRLGLHPRLVSCSKKAQKDSVQILNRKNFRRSNISLDRY